MNPQVLVPGMCFFHEKSDEVFYIANVNGGTAQLRRKITNDGKDMHDSHHTLFTNLIGVPLRRSTMLKEMGFYEIPGTDAIGVVIYPEVIRQIDGEPTILKHATELRIFAYEKGDRFTCLLMNSDRHVYLEEISFVHEVQHLIYALTRKLPLYQLTQKK